MTESTTAVRPTALVVGGGIGGMAAAVALQHVGWRVSLLERAPDRRYALADLARPLENALFLDDVDKG